MLVVVVVVSPLFLFHDLMLVRVSGCLCTTEREGFMAVMLHGGWKEGFMVLWFIFLRRWKKKLKHNI